MAKHSDVAKAFLNRRAAKVGSARTDGDAYYLHGNRIAWFNEQGYLLGDWCGWHTRTTATHLGTIARLGGYPSPGGYATARDEGTNRFIFSKEHDHE